MMPGESPPAASPAGIAAEAATACTNCGSLQQVRRTEWGAERKKEGLAPVSPERLGSRESSGHVRNAVARGLPGGGGEAEGAASLFSDSCLDITSLAWPEWEVPAWFGAAAAVKLAGRCYLSLQSTWFCIFSKSALSPLAEWAEYNQ